MLTGGTLSGNVLFPAGSLAVPSVQVGLANTGLSEASGALQLSTNGALAMSISSTQIPTFTAFGQGVVHSSSGGVLSSSLVTGSDIANATVTNANLITLSAPGLVANSATTATPLNTAGAIVARDGSFNFAAGTITASLSGAASLNLLLTGGVLSGNVLFPAGTFAAPSVQVGISEHGTVRKLQAQNCNFRSQWHTWRSKA